MTTAFHFCFRRVQVNQDGLKLHGTQLLVYVDDVKILDGSVHTMQKNRRFSSSNCNKVYIGQTGRPFKTRFKEHERDFHTKCNKSLYAKHLLEQQHQLSSIEECMSILEIQRKGKTLNTLEQFHIYTTVKSGNHLNEQYTDSHNAIFESILKQYPPSIQQ